jgi:Tol biopolymer transport system component
MIKRLSIILLVVSNSLFAQNGKDKVLVTDMNKIKTIGSVNLSPDGKKVIYSIRTDEPSEENKLEFDYRSHIWVSDFQTNKQLTRGLESVGSAIWSPDGNRLLLLVA